MANIKEQEWKTAYGHLAVVCQMLYGYNHRCGYVGVPKGHFLYGKDYDTQLDIITQEMVASTKIGSKSPILIFTACVNSDGENLIRRSLDILVDCHGGFTYARDNSNDYPTKTEEPYWFFGFDCAHANDMENPKSLAFCLIQCENISRQLATLEELLKELDAKKGEPKE